MERRSLHTAKRHPEEISDLAYCTMRDDRPIPIAQQFTGLKRGGFAVIVALLGCVTILMAAAETTYCGSESSGRESEARTILTGIYGAEMGYFSTENTFTDDPDAIGFETAATPPLLPVEDRAV